MIAQLQAVTQGSPLPPGVADMVLMVLEEVDAKASASESHRWISFASRWVDDVWMCIIGFVATDLSPTTSVLRVGPRVYY